MSAEGIEPSTNSLKGCCSAIELRARTLQSEGHSNMGHRPASTKNAVLPLRPALSLSK